MSRPKTPVALGRKLASMLLRLLPGKVRGELREVLKRELDRIINGRNVRKKHIVICGYPRSGTSLFYNMLSTSLDGFNSDDFERTSVQTIGLYDNHVSKSPLDTFEVRNLASSNIHNKEIIVFVLIRDVRDIITSIHPNVPNDYFMGYEACYRVIGQFPNYQATFDLPGVGEFFREINCLGSSADYKLRWIKYEELVSDADRVQEAIGREFGLAFKRSFTEFHLHKDQHGIKYEGPRRALDPSLVREDKEVSTASIGRWRLDKHRERIRQQFSQYPELFAILRTHGYTQDDNWFQDFTDDQGGRT